MYAIEHGGCMDTGRQSELEGERERERGRERERADTVEYLVRGIVKR